MPILETELGLLTTRSRCSSRVRITDYAAIELEGGKRLGGREERASGTVPEFAAAISAARDRHHRNPLLMSSSQASQSSQPFSLEGRHALVTGGASGIGEATVKELVRAGAFVWIADIKLTAAESLSQSLGSSQVLHLDVTSTQSIATAVSHLSRLDILVNNAGIGHVGSIEQTEPDDFDHLINVNVRSVYLVTRAFLPLLLAAGGNVGPRLPVGSIVNIASVAGLVGIKQRFTYCTTKGAVVAMTRQLAVEYPKTLRVNAICPGTVETPFVEGYLEKFHKHNKEEIRAELRARQPIGRLGRPDEVASMVRYLASEEAAFVSGSVLTIDGGWTAA
jgi:2-keto-3-deoxy-L-fuconate dehydrogenase